MNGDGYADLVVGAQSVTGVAYVYLGGASGLGSAAAATLVGPNTNAAFGHSVASAGDVNGDGYADVVIGDREASSNTGGAYVYLGGASGLATSPASTLSGPDGANGQFGFSVAGAGDVNGDHYSDLLVGAPTVSSNTGRAYLFSGGAGGFATTPSVGLTGLDAFGYFGYSVCGATN